MKGGFYNQMKSKTTVIKHGKLFMPPPSVVSVVCPECGKKLVWL